MLVDTRSVQRFLGALGLYRGPIDGDYGRGSIAASRALLAELTAKGGATYQPSWADARVRVGVEQALFESIGQDLGIIDGVEGPRTQIALARWQDHITFKRPPIEGATPHAIRWPNQAGMHAFYGAPGTNHTRITPPYPVFYGDQPVKTILINKRCAESASRILDAVLAHYGKEEIARLGLDRYGGCFNNRAMRNGTQLSTHAYAAAWDWDPARNGLRETSRTARMARPDYAAFIDAHEAEGWVSLGRARNFDFMHFQAVRLGK